MGLYPRKGGVAKIASNGGAAPVEEGLTAHYTASPLAPSATGTKAATALTSTAQTGVTAGITQPDVPRNLTVKGNASGVAGNVVLHGKDAGGAVISETIALNGATEVAGSKAFAHLTSVDLPAETHAGTDTVSIGRGSKLGLAHKLSRNTVLATYYNNAKEGTPPTLTFSSVNLSDNTALLNTTLAGARVDLYYLV